MHEERDEACLVTAPGDTMVDLLTLHGDPDDRLHADANNNGEVKSEKYSLRPRSLRQKTEKGLELKKDIITQRSKKCIDKNRPKQKPPPLSKYRRKTANARERNRMREINVAFETLRRAVPHISNTVTSGNEKLTKITTLRLAMKYIQALRQALDSNSSEATQLNSFLNGETDLDVLLSDGESLHFQSDISESFTSPDHPLTSPFSDPSGNSPALSDHQEFSDSGMGGMNFAESGIESSFEFDDTLPGGDFCDDFLNSHCVGLS